MFRYHINSNLASAAAARGLAAKRPATRIKKTKEAVLPSRLKHNPPQMLPPRIGIAIRTRRVLRPQVLAPPPRACANVREPAVGRVRGGSAAAPARIDASRAVRRSDAPTTDFDAARHCRQAAAADVPGGPAPRPQGPRPKLPAAALLGAKGSLEVFQKSKLAAMRSRKR